MNDIRYALLDPTGNLTVLVETAVQPENQPGIAKQIMEREPEAEQVGFLSQDPDGIALRMAGGEFCGNAAMSAAVLCAMDRGIPDGIVPVAVAGQPEPVLVSVTALPDGAMRGTLTMPDPVSVGEERFPDGALRPVVRFRGISHVILEAPLNRKTAEASAPVWCRLLGAESLGIMMLDRTAQTLVPLVYVPAADTLFWENSCASGTSAVGAFLAAEQGPGSWSLRQPGGSLRVEVSAAGKILLTGTVRLRYRRHMPIRAESR
ncbi:MAG: hypothetical protein K6A33_02095 [Clostridiales bacterium]|nr:hypothetical protein [Clostridiales bacterium]